MTQNLRDLKEGTFGGEALLTDKRVATAKNGKLYADLVFSDKTGSIKCKKWDYSDSSPLEVGGVYNITLEISTYQGELQGTVKHYKLTTLDPQDFTKGSRFDVNILYDEVLALVDDFTEPLTEYVTRNLMCRFMKLIKKAPAAKGQHNAWVGGLMEHIWSLCQCAKPIIEHYQTRYNSQFSKDKVIFGLCAHDLGKIVEYEYDAGIAYAPRGVLTPHIVMGTCWVYETANHYFKETESAMTAKEFERERDHLVHIVASHHNKPEWGSPVVPASLEAVLVHQLDMIDSKFMHAVELVEGKEGPIKGFSEKSWSEKTHYLQYTKQVPEVA